MYSNFYILNYFNIAIVVEYYLQNQSYNTNNRDQNRKDSNPFKNTW